MKYYLAKFGLALLFTAIAGVITLGFITPAAAQNISFADFSSVAGLRLNGTASVTATPDGQVLRLTKAECCSAGSAFTANPVTFLTGAGAFSTFFQFRITSPGGINPADGIVFAIRAPGTRPLGSTANSEGYDGIGQSIGVKIDTYQNTGEINDNHLAIQTSGVILDESAQTPYGVTNCTKPVGVPGCMANGDLWSVWIDYDGITLHVAVADNSTIRPADLIAAAVSLPAILGNASSAYAGFTAGTGGGFENHDIVNWQYSPSFNPTVVGAAQAMARLK